MEEPSSAGTAAIQQLKVKSTSLLLYVPTSHSSQYSWEAYSRGYAFSSEAVVAATEIGHYHSCLRKLPSAHTMHWGSYIQTLDYSHLASGTPVYPSVCSEGIIWPAWSRIVSYPPLVTGKPSPPDFSSKISSFKEYNCLSWSVWQGDDFLFAIKNLQLFKYISTLPEICCFLKVLFQIYKLDCCIKLNLFC